MTKPAFEGKSYTRFRPQHDSRILSLILSDSGTLPGNVIADVGAGNGNSSIPLLEAGYKVIAIEHNPSMVAELKQSTADQWYTKNLVIIPRKLEDVSGNDMRTAMEKLGYSRRVHADAVVAASSLHWLDRTKALPKLRTDIRKPAGPIIGISRMMDASDPTVEELHNLLVAIAPGYKNAETTFSKKRWSNVEVQAKRYLAPGYTKITIHEPPRLFSSFDEFTGYLKTVSSLKQLPESGEGLQKLHAFYDKYAKDGVLSLPWKYVACTGVPQYRTLPDPSPPPKQRG